MPEEETVGDAVGVGELLGVKVGVREELGDTEGEAAIHAVTFAPPPTPTPLPPPTLLAKTSLAGSAT